MGQASHIQWTTHTFNPWVGCTKVSDGCKNCYAETLMDSRYGKVQWGPKGSRMIKSEAGWKDPVKWDRWAETGVCSSCGGKGEFRIKIKGIGRMVGCADCQGTGSLGASYRARVFCASLSDVFEGPDTMPAEALPAVVSARARLINLIHRTPNLDWLLLTKRPENIVRLWDEAATEWGEPGTLAMPLPNVWEGTSCENQEAADERIPHLLQCPAAVRFISAEPLLGPINFDQFTRPKMIRDIAMAEGIPLLNWVIVGGESGPGARPCNVEWIRSIIAQCKAAGVACFVKQLGGNPSASIREISGGEEDDDDNIDRLPLADKKGGDWDEWSEDLRVRDFPAAPVPV